MKKGRNTTIYDIATAVQLSPSTVSRVLTNSNHPIRPEVRALILETAKQMNYIPNVQARGLKTQNNPSVGIIIPSIENPFYPAVVRGIEDEGVKHGYSTYLCNCERSLTRTNQYIQNMLEQNVRGIISLFLDEMPPRLQDFVDRGGHMVSLSCADIQFPGAVTLEFDKVNEAKAAVQHLIDLGHTKIAFCMNTMDCRVRLDKFQGYKLALEENGIPYNPNYFYEYGVDCSDQVTRFDRPDADTDAVTGDAFVSAILARSPEVTAILCMNDIIALGVISALRQRALPVPNHYSIMGFDDAFFSPALTPALTTMGIHRYELGVSLMDKFFAKVNGTLQRDTSEHNFVVPYLAVRESTAPPRT